MKKNITILATLFICFSLFSSSIIAADANVKDRVGEIKLKKESDGTRSGTATEVSAYINGDILTVETTNYAGSHILVEFFDEYGVLQAFAESACESFVVMDILSLPPGKYEIVVTLDYRYTGSFER